MAKKKEDQATKKEMLDAKTARKREKRKNERLRKAAKKRKLSTNSERPPQSVFEPKPSASTQRNQDSEFGNKRDLRDMLSTILEQLDIIGSAPEALTSSAAGTGGEIQPGRTESKATRERSFPNLLASSKEKQQNGLASASSSAATVEGERLVMSVEDEKFRSYVKDRYVPPDIALKGDRLAHQVIMRTLTDNQTVSRWVQQRNFYCPRAGDEMRFLAHILDLSFAEHGKRISDGDFVEALCRRMVAVDHIDIQERLGATNLDNEQYRERFRWGDIAEGFSFDNDPEVVTNIYQSVEQYCESLQWTEQAEGFGVSTELIRPAQAHKFAQITHLLAQYYAQITPASTGPPGNNNNSNCNNP